MFISFVVKIYILITKIVHIHGKKIHEGTLLRCPWIGGKFVLFTLHNFGFFEFVP